MNDLMVHRGPDDEGYHVDDGAGLCMRRLSIIDPAGGRQPIANEHGTIHAVVNGEIYNYRSLRRELVAQGHVFTTDSDAEVVVHGYEAFGTDCFRHLEGMFAVAIWDTTARCLTLGVDRFGIKPLLYAITPVRALFASELKCVRSECERPPSIEPSALAQYFALGYVPAPLTVLQGVRKLEPGHVLTWREGSLPEAVTYWEIPRRPSAAPLSRAAAQSAVVSVLTDAVQSHLVSDVPLGAFLSGGIDSSALVALMSRVSDSRVKTFSVGFADERHDELDLARLVAKRFNTEHRELIVEPDSLDVLPEIARQFDEPFSDPAALPTYQLSRAAREHIKVAISGTAATSCLSATRCTAVWLVRSALPPSGVRATAGSGVCRHRFSTRSMEADEWLAAWQRRLRQSLAPPPVAYALKVHVGEPSIVERLLSDEFRSVVNGAGASQPLLDCLGQFTQSELHSSLEPYVYAGLRLGLTGQMLPKIDRMSMANSLEVRVPFLDHRVAEFACTLPVHQRFPRMRLKGLLRDAVAPMLPKEVMRHRKQGFGPPLHKWFRGSLAKYASEVLLDGAATSSGYYIVCQIWRGRCVTSAAERCNWAWRYGACSCSNFGGAREHGAGPRRQRHADFGGQSDRKGIPCSAARGSGEKLIECAVYTARLVPSVDRTGGLGSSGMGVDERPRPTE